jgi:hypothetical protein
MRVSRALCRRAVVVQHPEQSLDVPRNHAPTSEHPRQAAEGVCERASDLYALTNPQHTPWAVPHRVLFRDVPCKHCHKSVCPEGHGHCLTLVEPAEVVQAALALLDGAAST